MSASDTPTMLNRLVLFGPSGFTRSIQDYPKEGFLSSSHERAIAILAFGLSRQRRYTGLSPVTVARHSVLVSELVPKEHALVALLHDAQEAIVGDVAKPVKQLLWGTFDTLEREIRWSFDRYSWARYAGRPLFPTDCGPEVAQADEEAARLEEVLVLGDGFFTGIGKQRENATCRVSAYERAQELFHRSNWFKPDDDAQLFWKCYWRLREPSVKPRPYSAPTTLRD